MNPAHGKLAGIQTKRLRLRNRKSVDIYSFFRKSTDFYNIIGFSSMGLTKSWRLRFW